MLTQFVSQAAQGGVLVFVAQIFWCFHWEEEDFGPRVRGNAKESGATIAPEAEPLGNVTRLGSLWT